VLCVTGSNVDRTYFLGGPYENEASPQKTLQMLDLELVLSREKSPSSVMSGTLSFLYTERHSENQFHNLTKASGGSTNGAFSTWRYFLPVGLSLTPVS
jgi:hypothetical protein